MRFQGEGSIGGAKNRCAAAVFPDPSLIEDSDDFASGTENPSHAGLPAEVSGFVVELDQSEERQQR